MSVEGERNTDIICAICLDGMKDSICTYACGHRFHSTCIQIWLAEKSTCPACRATIGSCEHDTHSSETMSNVIDYLRNTLKIVRRECQESADALFALQQYQQPHQRGSTVFISIM